MCSQNNSKRLSFADRLQRLFLTKYPFSDIVLFMRDKILSKLKKDVAEKSISQVAGEIGIPYTNLYRIVNKQGGYTVRTWDKIETFYTK